jgi:hypothetical protein
MPTRAVSAQRLYKNNFSESRYRAFQEKIKMKYKHAKQWNVLLVQNTGKTVKLSLQNGILIIGCMILLTAASTAGVMTLVRNPPSQESAEAKHVSSEEPLQANLAVHSGGESQGSIDPSRESTGTAAEVNEDQNDGGSTDETSVEKAAKVVADTEEPKTSESDTILSVAIQNPSASYDKKHQVLTFRYKLKNLTESPVSGHAVVILKRSPKRPKTWITLPENVPLINEKPDGETEGNSFSISNYKVMRFSAKEVKNPKRYNIASIFIFNKSGKLMMEEDHPITID